LAESEVFGDPVDDIVQPYFDALGLGDLAGLLLALGMILLELRGQGGHFRFERSELCLEEGERGISRLHFLAGEDADVLTLELLAQFEKPQPGSLVGCNTVAGFGKDMQRAGEATQKSANRNC